MIRVGRYTIRDWKYKYYYGTCYYDREIYIPFENEECLISWIRIINYEHKGEFTGEWILEICCSSFYNLFNEIHEENFDNNLFFNSPIDGKKFVDNTLNKLSKLKVFL